MLLPFTILVLFVSVYCDGNAQIHPVSQSKPTRPPVVVEHRTSTSHVFDFVGHELVDKRYKVSWLHLLQSSLKPSVEVSMDTDFVLSFNYTIVCTNKDRVFQIDIRTLDNNILAVTNENSFYVSCENATADSYNLLQSEIPTTMAMATQTKSHLQRLQSAFYYYDGKVDFHLTSGVLGKTLIEFVLDEVGNITTKDGQDKAITDEAHIEVIQYSVSVFRKMRPVDQLFKVIVYCMQVFVMIGFGIKLDIQIVKEHLWKPVAPVMGLCCQYIVMPLIAFGLAKAINIDSDIVALGVFIAGCCPGGGGSNMYVYLLKGNLSLSITMTTISTVTALGMLPLWVYTLGSTFLKDKDLQIPFSTVAVSLSILITPLVMGIFFRQNVPKLATTIQKILKPTILVMALLLTALGVYSNMYVFRLFELKTFLVACLLPYVGCIAGGTVALVGRRDWKTVKTISIETGMQNTSIAYILMTSSFPAPEGDIGSIAPLASFILMPIPLSLLTLVYVLYGKLKKKYTAVDQTDEIKEAINNENHEVDSYTKA